MGEDDRRSDVMAEGPGGPRGRRHRHRVTALAAATLTAAAAATVVAVGGAGSATGNHLTARLTRAATSGPSVSTHSSDASTVASSVEGGVVDIVTTLGYQSASAAGTGMVLTSTGEILTNNHVVNGATGIQVTVVSTGRTYAASVVGTDPTRDVAVIQLKGASGLKTIPIGDSSAVAVGQRVVALGNAGGQGGQPSVVTGTVTATEQSITVSDEGGADAEQLAGPIQTDAPIVAGDSGGPLATGSGQVIGMDTAASADNAYRTAASEGYAIPIQTALTIANQIEAGRAGSTVHLGVHGFLGIALQGDSSPGGANSGGYPYDPYGSEYGSNSQTTSGVVVAGVDDSGPAASAGIRTGDVITSVDGRAVDGASTLRTVMASTRAGQSVPVGWTDTSGQSHSASIALGTAPAD